MPSAGNETDFRIRKRKEAYEREQAAEAERKRKEAERTLAEAKRHAALQKMYPKSGHK